MSGRPELLLAVDTAGAEAGVALAGEGHVDTILLSSKAGGFARTEDLAGEVAALLSARGRSVPDLTMLGAVVGPGSYTGLRSGLAFLRGLAFADSIPVVAVGSLELLAWRGSAEGESVAAMMPAGPQRFVAATYLREIDDVRELCAPALVEADDCAAYLSGLAGVGEGIDAVVLEASRTGRPSSAASAAATSAGDTARDLVHSSAVDSLCGAARAIDLDVRVAQQSSLEALTALVASRGRRGHAVRAESLLPIYVGQSTARPNRHRVAVLEVAE